MSTEAWFSLTSLTDTQNLGIWSALGGCADTDLPEDKWPGSPELLAFLCKARGSGPWWSLIHSWCFKSPYPTGMGSTELAQRSAAVTSYFKNPVVVVYIPHFQWFEQGALFHFKLRTSVLFLLFSGYLRWLSAQIFMPSSWDWALDNQEYKVMKAERKEAKK